MAYHAGEPEETQGGDSGHDARFWFIRTQIFEHRESEIKSN